MYSETCERCGNYKRNPEVFCKICKDKPDDTSLNTPTNNKVKFTTNESCDWEILKYKDFERSGHHIDTDDWLDLIRFLGYKTESNEISDEEMESLCRIVK